VLRAQPIIGRAFGASGAALHGLERREFVP
jgi:hypothetical protein